MRGVLSQRREAIGLALGLWVLATVAHLLFAWAIGAQPVLFLFPFVWAAHGLLLTLPLMVVVERSQGWSAAGRWGAIGAAVLGLTLAQTWLDQVSSLQLATLLRSLLDMKAFVAAIRFDYGSGMREIGAEISAMIYLGVFGCYAVALNMIEAQARAARSEAAANESRLLALRFQVNTHLLFNALNSVSSLIMAGDNNGAEAANQALSGFLRRTLEADPVAPWPLAEELDTTEAFLDIERVRFGDRLDVVIEAAPDTLHWPTPPFILQPLVENAVKYGAAPGRRTQVRIVARRDEGSLVLSVANPVTERRTQPGTGTGLRNVGARLASLYGDRARLDVSDAGDVYEARLTLPMIA